MPMPGKSPEEQAKQGVLQYAKAWGGATTTTTNPIQSSNLPN
jgi:hypothetical protein